MSHLFFSHPAGFWALLGLPAIVLIHFLQRQSRRVITSTLFLLDQLAPESAQGRRFERLRNSASLWLQLLAILLLAWLLAGPRWIRPDSTQSIAIVLDSSASMSAFLDDAKKNLADKVGPLASAAARTDWTLLESVPERRVLYSGTDAAALIGALANWHPNLGSHDPEPALRTARGLVRGKGLVIFVTDRAEATFPGVTLLAIGSPFPNLGFTGLRADESGWRVLVRNYGAQAVHRIWQIDGQNRGQLDLAPGAIEELHGDFPGLLDKLTLTLDADHFTLDDRLPMVRPQAKLLGLYAEPSTPFDEFFQKFGASVAHRSPTGRDLSLVRYDPLLPHEIEGNAVVFLDQPGKAGKLLAGPLLTENHPLVAGLNWQGLLVNDTLSIVPRDTDDWLVSQGGRPLLLLRHNGKYRALLVNFDLRYSNADRLPAFILTLHRFVETIRATRPEVEALNVETSQILPDGTRAGADPGFFERPSVKGAAHFADAREADFSAASSVDGLKSAVAELRQKNSEQDFLTPLWTLLLLTALGASWLTTASRRTLSTPS